VYERLIKYCVDSGWRDTLTFLMTREIAHQKMFEAALDAIVKNFPPGRLPGDQKMAHEYFNDSAESGDQISGFELVSPAKWGFNLRKPSEAGAAEPPSLKPRPSVESKKIGGNGQRSKSITNK
jgi:Mn-containing catalase